VRGRLGSSWVIVENARREKSTFLKNFLSKRFPKHSFFYRKLQQATSAHRATKSATLEGVIAELKSLNEQSLPLIDRLHKEYKNCPMILILTPAVYQVLNRRRKRLLDRTTVLISETKSLDYLIQLPRFMDEVGRKRRLRFQNERLQRLAERHLPNFNGQGFSAGGSSERDLLPTLMSRDRSSQCGLKVKIQNWRQTSKVLGEFGRNEVVDLVSRMIHEIVRNTDRVLRSQEDEFIIFLSNASPDHTNRCKDRLEKALENFTLSSNERDLKFPFAISALEQLH